MAKNPDAWLRHCDMLLWIVTTIWVTAIGGLLVYAKSNPSSNLLLALFGFGLTITAVFFAAGFRDCRYILVEKYENDGITNLYPEKRNKLFYQWPPYVFIFVILGEFWIKFLIDKKEEWIIAWIILGLIGTGFMIYCGYLACGIDEKTSTGLTSKERYLRFMIPAVSISLIIFEANFYKIL